MKQDAGIENAGVALAVLDALPLRRSGVVQVLAPWAEELGLTVIATTPTAPDFALPGGRRWGLAVLSVGGTSIRAPQVQEWCRNLKAGLSGVPLLFISDLDDPEEAMAAFQAGARGYIPTSVEPWLAGLTIGFVLSGGSFVPPTVLTGRAHTSPVKEIRAFECRAAGDTSAPCWSLTSRQHEVLRLLREGKSNKIIARQLTMSEATVKVHVRQIMRKLGAANRTQAALSAVVGAETSNRAADHLEDHCLLVATS